jgi:hypothetical protein
MNMMLMTKSRGDVDALESYFSSKRKY